MTCTLHRARRGAAKGVAAWVTACFVVVRSAHGQAPAAPAEEAEAPAVQPETPAERPVAPAESARVLGLSEALATARARQPSLRRARAEVDHARARVAGALAPLLPQVSGFAQYQRTTANFVPRPSFQVRTGDSRPSPDLDTFNFYNFGLSASQLLYDFGASHGSYQAVKEEARAEVQTARATQQEVDLVVRTAFFEALALQELVRVAREALANQERHLAQAQAFVDVGTRPEIDVAQARNDVANAKVQLIRAENDYQISKARLNQAMGVEASDDYTLAADSLPPISEEDGPATQAYETALRERPELAALERRARAQRMYTRAAKGTYGPRLSLVGNYTHAGIELDALVWNWNIGVLASWDLYQGGAPRAAIRQAEAFERSVRADHDATRQAVHFEVEQARLGVRASKAVLSAAEEALTHARERLKLAEGRYAAGVGNVIELGDAQLALTAAEAQRVQADFNLSAARALLVRALGRSE